MAWNQNGNIRGASGVPGASGLPGATGPQGPQGATGATGASGGTGGTGGPGTTSWNDITDKPGAILNYKGTWNANTNSPSLSDGTGTGGDVYRVSVAGSRNLGSGTISWEIGDYAIWSPVTSSWEKADTTDAVSSVAGRTGAVTLTSADLGASGSASSSTFLRGDNTWAIPAGITRSVQTVTTNDTTIASTANTDYFVFANIDGVVTETDSNYSSVTARLSGNGSNNSTTITDGSTLASNWTTSGNAKISTSVKKYGTGSISFDGTLNTYITPTAASSNFAFGTGDFTVEYWVYANSWGDVLLANWASTTVASGYPNIYPAGSSMNWYNGSSLVVNAGSSLATATWYHVAFCRSGTTMRAFLNGSLNNSATDTANYLCASGRPLFGGYHPSQSGYWFNGYVDDVRITKGVARYTSQFTPPSEFQQQTLGSITLPTAVSNTNIYRVQNIHPTVSLVIKTTSSQTIDGATTVTLSTGLKTSVISDGANYRTV